MADPDKIHINQAARMLGLDPISVRAWFRDNNLHVWKRDKVLLTDVALLSAEISAFAAAVAKRDEPQESPETTLQHGE